MNIKDIKEIIDNYHKRKGKVRKLAGFFTKNSSGFDASKGIIQLTAIYNYLQKNIKDGDLTSDHKEILKKCILLRLERMRNSFRDMNTKDKLTDECYILLAKKLGMNIDLLLTPVRVDTKSYTEKPLEKLCFRGDSRKPDVIFSEGLKPRSNGKNRVTSPFVSDEKNVICASDNFKSAAFFPFKKIKNTYIYLVYMENGFDVFDHGVKTLTKQEIIGAVRLGWVKEIITDKTILPQNILAAVEIERVQGNSFLNNAYYWRTFKARKIHFNADANSKLVGMPSFKATIDELNKIISSDEEIPIPVPLDEQKECERYINEYTENQKTMMSCSS
ncbi:MULTISPECIES: hypothetical protein [unclassified Legionella]|uniref:hypothetical protein n=1 Tax=unclassified Legionella TaxID=2622702 RepID=UPI001054EE86|nr:MULTISPECIES: hypothetical protein [unclassified Legionella]MDI9818827.1 hypothetical protein [Legionella sp. PL877]